VKKPVLWIVARAAALQRPVIESKKDNQFGHFVIRIGQHNDCDGERAVRLRL
jgi:hypothetical protein